LSQLQRTDATEGQPGSEQIDDAAGATFEDEVGEVEDDAISVRNYQES
jgi:hypothetical protein